MNFKIPVSVLVVIHTPALDVLLIERAKHPGLWQSVTGSMERGESLLETSRREVFEETGIEAPESAFIAWNIANNFRITLTPERFAPGTTHNREHVFSLCVPSKVLVTLAPDEHIAYCWLPYAEAAAECFSWSNRDAVLMLPARTASPSNR
ncbi:MAG: dihydroneopterin triphosphate diphosphatase [Verrucomicrobia bacterium]|nr:MAG: dihydroneopterin triphosphate diphosphatase [Verrucomicrobiota bacterium]